MKSHCSSQELGEICFMEAISGCASAMLARSGCRPVGRVLACARELTERMRYQQRRGEPWREARLSGPEHTRMKRETVANADATGMD